jgi:hypothetical protein
MIGSFQQLCDRKDVQQYIIKLELVGCAGDDCDKCFSPFFPFPSLVFMDAFSL